MAHQLHTKSLHTFTLKPSCQITSTSLKLKTLAIQAFLYKQVCRHVARALALAKSVAMGLLNPTNNKDGQRYNINLRRQRNKKKKNNNNFFCCTRSSSHVIPMPEPESHAYYDSTWNSIIPTMEVASHEDIGGYLQWLEEKEGDDGGASEIDRLAEKFIERCHEKFRLEKQESYRRYQEMLARSL